MSPDARPPYLYFLSYPRAAFDEHLRGFYEDLEREVRVHAPPGAVRSVNAEPAAMGFFDQEGLERGSDWPAELEGALQECCCFVALYGPAYFARGFAERELRAFEARRNAAGVPPRHVVKPVIWLPNYNVPDDLSHLQFKVGNPQALENVKGLRALKKLPNDPEYKKAYETAVEALA